MKKYVTDINNKVFLQESRGLEKDFHEALTNTITINPKETITDFLGFGSAITESSGFNYAKLSEDNQKNFIHDYYSKDGLNYTFGRISIGSNDFSLRSFAYAKKKDLSDFSLQHDYHYVIPFLQDIINTKKISLIASPWSPPKMYKRLPFLYYGIGLAKRYYEKYSQYLVKYLEEYQKMGINIPYITMQNEPLARQRWESCKFSVKRQKDFIYHYLLPKLKDTKLLLWDHNKDHLFDVVNELYCDHPQIAGTCFHYYTGHNFSEIDKIRKKYPKMLLVNSEMCTGYAPYNETKWIRDAEYYLCDIIGDMNNGVNAYLDWNILLDENGGPTYKKNYVKSASVLVNDNYIKSPIYYYLYHISHFLSGHDKIIKSHSDIKELKVVSLKCHHQIIVVIMNNSNKRMEYNLVNNQKYLHDFINSHSIITYIIEDCKK